MSARQTDRLPDEERFAGLASVPTGDLELDAAWLRATERSDRAGALESELQRRAIEAAKDELEAARARLALVLDHAPVGYFVLDADALIVEANPAAERLVGVERSRLVGWPLVSLAESPHRALLAAHLAGCERNGRAQCDVNLRTPNRRLPVRLQSVALASRQPAQVLVAMTDLSEQRAVEDRLRTTREELQSRVLSRTADLEEANRKLGASVERAEQLEVELRLRVSELARIDRNKDEFLAMLAHELRNPLAPIAHAVELLQLGTPEPRQVEWACAIIARQVDHLRRLVDDLLDLARITHGTLALARDPVDLAVVVQRAVELASPLVEARAHRLVVRRLAEPLVVAGDRERLIQAVANLLGNAAKYTPEGGVITVETGAADDQAIVRVTDNGQGMDGALLARVFDAFEQGDQSLARAQGGLGIGLTLVKRIAEQHGGSAVARSDGPDKGSVFELRLPRSAQPAPGAARAEQPTPCEPRRVLIVEDNPDALETLAELLRREGHDVRVAAESAQALREAVEFRPDVALLDIGLPGMNGYELANRLRALPETSRAMLVALTGYGTRADVDRSRAAGFDEHLIKPVDLARLNALLARAAG